MDETPHPWDRQRDAATGQQEPARWFARFTAYCTTPPTARSILGTVNAERARKGQRKTNNVPGAWKDAAERWRWKARAEAWDAHERARYEMELEAARLEAIANQREDARLMREKARAILNTLPLVKQIGSDRTGEPLVIAPASSAEYRAAQALLDSAAKLEAARLGLPAEPQRMDVTTGGQPLDTAFESALRKVYGKHDDPGNLDDPTTPTPDRV